MKAEAGVTRIGLIGCGNISGIYLENCALMDGIEVTACSDLDRSAAQAAAERFGIEALSPDELLARPEIEIVLNLTTPQAHAEISGRALQAGKHLYSEKPLALSRREGRALLDRAARSGLLVGCAPDTFLGAGIETCRKAIDRGAVGRPVAGTAFMMCRGHESWHPDPGFYYRKGGGPLFDMGPYYLTALLTLLGPARRVSAAAAISFPERVATSEACRGAVLPVEVPTHLAGTIEFENGALVTMVMSFDVWRHGNHPIEIHGEEGSLQVPDPNTFGGPVRIARPGSESWEDLPLQEGETGNACGLGLVDLARAVRTGAPPRCSGDLAYHVLDLISAFEESAASGRHVEIMSRCERPQPLSRR